MYRFEYNERKSALNLENIGLQSSLTVMKISALFLFGAPEKPRWNSMKTQEFDKKFDAGQEDIIDDLDLSTLKHPNRDQKRVNVDFPSWVIESLDREAKRIGVTRQSLIKLWLVERLEEQTARH